MTEEKEQSTLSEVQLQQKQILSIIKDLKKDLSLVIEQQHHQQQYLNALHGYPGATGSANGYTYNNIPKLKLEPSSPQVGFIGSGMPSNRGSRSSSIIIGSGGLNGSVDSSQQHQEKSFIEKWIQETNPRKKNQESSDNIIKLDVGGKFYSTTISTLNKYSDSMLATMFSGQYQLNKDKDGRIFIDRDGQLFSYILSFLRDGPLWTPPIDLELKRKIDLEFSYFGLPTFGYGFNYHSQTNNQLASIVSPNITPRCVCGIKHQTLGQDNNHQGQWEETPGMASNIKSFRLLVSLNNTLYAITERTVEGLNAMSNGGSSSSSSISPNINSSGNGNGSTSSSPSSTSSNGNPTNHINTSSGGTNTTFQFEEYNPRSNSWGMVCPIMDSMICYFLTSVVVGNDIYAIPDAGLHQPIFKYDSKENKWKYTDAHLPTGRTSFTLQAVGEYIYVIGGYKGSTTTDTVDRYHPRSNSWCSMSNMLSKRAEMVSVVLDDDIYVMGGSNIVEKYNPHSNQWSIVGAISSNHQRITISSAATLNGKIYSIGCEESDSLNIVLQYNVQSNTWKRVAPLLFSTYTSYSTLTIDGYLYFIPWTGSVIYRYESCSN